MVAWPHKKRSLFDQNDDWSLSTPADYGEVLFLQCFYDHGQMLMTIPIQRSMVESLLNLMVKGVSQIWDKQVNDMYRIE